MEKHFAANGAVKPEVASADRSELLTVIACCALAVAGQGFYNVMPLLFGAIANHRGYTDSQVGWLGSVELGGMFLGYLHACWALRKTSHMTLALWGVIVVFVTVVGSALAPDFNSLAIVRLAGGWAAGLTYSVAIARLALTQNSDRSFSHLNAVLVVIGAAQTATLPLIIVRWGIIGAFASLFVICLVGAALISGLRAKPMSEVEVLPGVRASNVSSFGGVQILFLVATGLCQFGPAVVWTYLDRVGQEAGMTEAAVGWVMTVNYIIGAIGCFFAWHLGRHIGQHRSMMLIAGLLVLNFLSWFLPLYDLPGFVVRIITFGLLWGLASVYQQTAMNLLDPSGRSAALVPAAQGVGLAIGPVAGALMVDNGASPTEALGLAGIFGALGFIAYLLVYILFRKNHPDQANL